MKNTKIKFILLFYIFLAIDSTAKINAMENNNKNQHNLNKSVNITTNQKQRNKSFNKKLNNLNLFNSKENEILKHKSFDKKINNLNLDNDVENFNIGKKLEKFEMKFSSYLNELVPLEMQLLLNTENNLNQINLDQIIDNYKKQKQKIEKTNNEYNIFLNVNLTKISENIYELLYEDLIDEISKNIIKIENKIKGIDAKLNTLNQSEDLNLVNSKKNEILNLNNAVENLNIEQKLKKFDMKFSNYLKDLVNLKKQLTLNTKKNLNQIKNNYKKQKQEIKNTENEFKIFLNMNLPKISEDEKNESLCYNLINKIYSNNMNITNEITAIDSMLNTLNQSEDLNLFNSKENEILKHKSFDKKINNLNLNNAVENLNIEPKLKKFDVKFSNYLEYLVNLKKQLTLNTKKNLNQIKNNYKKQKQEIEKTENEYDIFLNNLTKISKNKKNKLLCDDLINKIYSNRIYIIDIIGIIDKVLNNLNQSEDLNLVNSKENEILKHKSFDKKIDILNLDISSATYPHSHTTSNEKNLNNNLNNNSKINTEYENDEEKKFVIKKLLDEINTKFISYTTINIYLYKLLKILENSVDTTQNLFLNYIYSIKNQPMEEIFELKTKYEKNSNETKELIKKFDEFKEMFFKNLNAKIQSTIRFISKDIERENFLNTINEIKNLILEIDEMVNNFLMFDTKSEEYVYYSFLKKSNQKNYEKNKPDFKIDKLTEEFDNIKQLNKIIENNINFNTSDIFDIPNILKKLNLKKIAEDEINLINQKEEKLNTNIKETNNSNKNDFNIDSIKEFSKEISTKYENTLNSFIDLLKDINNDNKFNNFKKQNRDLMCYYKNKNIENFIKEDSKQNFINTINTSKDIAQKTVMQALKIYETFLNLNLKPTIDIFFNLQNQIKENIKNNEKKIILEKDWDEFIRNWNSIIKTSYDLDKLNKNINSNFKNLNELEDIRKKVNDFTLILKSVEAKPFVNLLTNELNSNNKTYNSLLFETQIHTNRLKLNNLFSNYINKLINILNSDYWEITPIEHCRKHAYMIKNFCKGFRDFLNNYKKFEDQNIKIYEKEALEEKINYFKNIIKETNLILDKTNEFIKKNTNENILKENFNCNFKHIVVNNLNDDIKNEIIKKIKENGESIQNIILNKNKNI